MALVTVDNTEKALDRVIDDLNHEDFNKFVAVYTEEIQEIETALIELASQKNLNVVTGVWLDYLGKLIGEPRSGRSDEPYRAALQIKIAVNTSDGTPNKIISLVKSYTNSSSVRLREGTLAWATLYVNGQDHIDSTLHQMVDEIKAVGTRWIIESDVNNDALDMAYEEAINESFFANIPAQAGDFEVQCGEPGASCGDSILKQVNTMQVGYYPPSVNEKNFLAWETVQTVVVIQCGEPAAQCGEQGAQCGNTKTFTETDVVRPLRWEVTENSAIQ